VRAGGHHEIDLPQVSKPSCSPPTGNISEALPGVADEQRQEFVRGYEACLYRLRKLPHPDKEARFQLLCDNERVGRDPHHV
jgi:hypothetical protein